jgi:hypothetical protein
MGDKWEVRKFFRFYLLFHYKLMIFWGVLYEMYYTFYLSFSDEDY